MYRLLPLSERAAASVDGLCEEPSAFLSERLSVDIAGARRERRRHLYGDGAKAQHPLLPLRNFGKLAKSSQPLCSQDVAGSGADVPTEPPSGRQSASDADALAQPSSGRADDVEAQGSHAQPGSARGAAAMPAHDMSEPRVTQQSANGGAVNSEAHNGQEVAGRDTSGKKTETAISANIVTGKKTETAGSASTVTSPSVADDRGRNARRRSSLDTGHVHVAIEGKSKERGVNSFTGGGLSSGIEADETDAQSVRARRPHSKTPSGRSARTHQHAEDIGETQLLIVRVVWGLMALAAINIFIIFGARPTFRNPTTDEVQSWEPYVVLNAIISSIVLLAIGLPADLLLLGVSSAFCTLRIITCEELLGGLSNEGVVAVAALCAVSAAIDKTKALDAVMGKCLGEPTSTSMGLIRLAIPLISLGSVFNSTPLVAVFIPIVKDWTRRVGLDVGHFMMPLSFFAMLSATLTTMGSSTNLLAVKLVPEADIAFLDPAPVGVLVILTGVLYCTVLAPCMLPSCGCTDDGDAAAAAPPRSLQDRFTVYLKVAHEGPLLGHAAKSAGLLEALQAPAKIRCSVGDGSKELEVGERLEVSDATAEDIISLVAIPGFKLQKFSKWYVHPSLQSTDQSGAKLWKKAKQVQMAMRFKSPASPKGQTTGLPTLTSSTTLQSLTQDFESGIEQASRLTMPVRRWVAAGMGGGWEYALNFLCKLVVPPGGPRGLGCKSSGTHSCSVSFQELEFYLSELECTLVGTCGVAPDENSCVTFSGGELLLVETKRSAVNDELRERFALVIPVEEQAPPSKVLLSPMDKFRPFMAVGSLLATVFVAALDLAPLDAVAILVALSSILLGTITGKDLYRSINGPVLLTVAASFGAGAAIYNTGLATCLASGVLFVAEGAGHAAIMAALVGLALTLGVFVSNNTVVILLAPLIKDICERQNMSLKTAMLSVIYAANLSFATPFSYQTNMMVMPHGHYVFLDYVKFGVPMMVLCGIVALLGTYAYWGC